METGGERRGERWCWGGREGKKVVGRVGRKYNGGEWQEGDEGRLTEG